MTNQTTKNDPADRSDKAKIGLNKRLRSLWWAMRDSNPRPSGCKPDALAN